MPSDPTINVRDYGATGNGVTDDTAAINSAIAALPANNSCLYFPPGNYQTTGAFTLASLTNLLIFGHGAQLYQTVNANQMFTVQNTCSFVTFQGLWLNGVGSARANGIHIRMECDYGSVLDCRIERSSDFGVLFDGGATTIHGCRFIGNLVKDTCGDGMHLGNVDGFVVADNVFWQTGDDSLAAIGYTSSGVDYYAKNGTIAGNFIYGRTTELAGINTNGHGGIRLEYASNILVTGNTIWNTNSTGIEVNDDDMSHDSIYNTNITISGNQLYSCMQVGAALGSILVNFAKQCVVKGNSIYSPFASSGISFADVVDLEISNNTILTTLAQFCRGITCDGNTSYGGRNYATTWSNVSICGNRFTLNQTSNNEGVYLHPASSISIANLLLTENRGFSQQATWIDCDYIATGKFVNNTSIGGSGISTGSHSTGITTANNN